MNRPGCAALTALAMTVAGCAEIEPPRGEDCAGWFARLDETVDRAGVGDAGGYRIPGFPYLRADRFSASFRYEAKDTPAAFTAWVGRLKALDATARGYELGNLPMPLLGPLGTADRHAAIVKSEACAAELGRADLAAPSQRERLVERAAVPDNYSDQNRILGLYPLAALPFSVGVNRWQQQTVEMFRRVAAGEWLGEPIIRYQPPGKPLGEPDLAALLARVPSDPLGIPQFGREDREQLFRAFAPILEIATAGDDDRFGPLEWRAGLAPEVDVADPTVYRRLAFTRYRGRILPQLVYTIWFPERPRDGSFDLLAGRLDGLVFRVTLDRRGRPLVYDTIHPCGCYHMFFPTARVKIKPSPQPGTEWAFVPATLPAADPAQRIVLRVASGTHYLVGVAFDTGGAGIVYGFAEDDALRALPTPGGATRSAFGPDGIVPGTERNERLLFWPTGVDDTGAMRQWGKHATAFLGRRHFDDPDLIERRFSIIER